MKRVLIFAYGSLVNFHSAERTLQRMLTPEEVRAAFVTGFERVWDYTSIVYSDSLRRPATAVFLNLRPKASARVNGLIFGVNEQELVRLKAREANYALVDITAQLNFTPPAPVYTFICYDKAFLAAHKTDCVVMNKYIEMVKEGFCSRGDDYYTEYLQTTEPVAFPIVDGDYSFPE